MTPIITFIQPDPSDPTYCGGCRFNRNARSCTRQCFLFHQRIPDALCRAEAKRIPACLAAEKLYADLAEAGQCAALASAAYTLVEVRAGMPEDTSVEDAWDTALAAIAAAKEAEGR